MSKSKEEIERIVMGVWKRFEKAYPKKLFFTIGQMMRFGKETSELALKSGEKIASSGKYCVKLVEQGIKIGKKIQKKKDDAIVERLRKIVIRYKGDDDLVGLLIEYKQLKATQQTAQDIIKIIDKCMKEEPENSGVLEFVKEKITSGGKNEN